MTATGFSRRWFGRSAERARERCPPEWRPNKEHRVVTIGAALAVVIVGVLIAVLANSTIGMIVAAIGVVGLILALVSGSRARL